MNSKRNIIILAVITLSALLVTASWDVLVASNNSRDAIDMWNTSQGIPLGGSWICTVPIEDPELGHIDDLVTEWTLSPQNLECTRFNSVLRQVKQNPTFWGSFPEADRETDWIGLTVQTGWNTFESTVVQYGTKKVEEQPLPQIVYIQVMYGNGRLVDLNTIEAEGTSAIFLQDQDANGDGFPDEGQEPIWCGPYTVTCKRVQIMPPCKLTQSE
jgi:hypothetical protein